MTSDARKERDLLTSGSGASFFGAQAYVSSSTTTTPQGSTSGKSIDGGRSARSKSPRARPKPPVRPKSIRVTKKPTDDDSTKDDGGGGGAKDRNLSMPVTESDFLGKFMPNAEHGDMYSNRRVVSRMEDNGVDLYQMRTVRLNGELVVQRRSCHLVKPSVDDTSIRLLRNDDTIVEIFQMSQLQRVVIGAKTPTSKRAISYTPGPNGVDDRDLCHKWAELGTKVQEKDVVTVIYGNQYLDFQIVDEEVNAKQLANWLVWVTVLASMNTEMPEPDDEAFGGSGGGGRRGSMGVAEAFTLSAGGFEAAPEYGELPGAPIERVSEVSVNLNTPTSAFRVDLVGCITCHGSELCRSSNPDMTISAKHNQDAACSVWPVGGQSNVAFFGVFDGHGESGHRCSHYCMRRVVDYVTEHVSEVESDPGGVLTRAYLEADQLLGQRHPAWAEYGGTTACSVLMVGKQLTIANCGDSRFVLGRRRDEKSPLEHKDLSVDQNPDNPSEQARIKKAGGYVGREDEGSEIRVWMDSSMSSSGLSMARSLGDHTFKAAGIISEPVITEHTIRSKDEVLVGASDGVFSVLSSREVMKVIEDISSQTPGGHRMVASRTAQEILTKSARKWKEEEGDMRDDISVIVIKLPLSLSENSKSNSTSVSVSKPTSSSASAAGDLVKNEDELKEKIRRRIENSKLKRESSSSSSSSTPTDSFKERKRRDSNGSSSSLQTTTTTVNDSDDKQPRESSLSGEKANCSGKHGLRAYNSPNDKLVCNRCNTALTKGTPFYGCKTCKTRVCVTCYRAGGIV